MERQFPLLSEAFRAQVAGVDDPRNALRARFSRTPATNAIDQMLYVDAKTYLAGDILTKVNRMCMLNSLEVRAPLLTNICGMGGCAYNEPEASQWS